MNLTLIQIEEQLEHRLKEAGLAKFVLREQSQFLNLDDELFVELVLNDASALHDVERVVRHTAEELRANGIRLGSVIRALWEVVEVHFVGPCSAPSGGIRAAWEFRATLNSGTRSCMVTVEVSEAALDVVRQKLGTDGDLDNNTIAGIVRNFLEVELSRGGTSYWDPLLNRRLSLYQAEMSFLLGYGTSFAELAQAVTDALEPPVLSSFLADLSRSGIRIRDFDAVLPGLSNLLSGAFRSGEKLSTSASELFSKLKYTEQELLRQYFRRRVEKLEIDSPELKKKFPKVFS